MFEKGKVKRRLREILELTFEAGRWNKEIVQKKLSLYKQWKMQLRKRNEPDTLIDPFVDESIKVVRMQFKRFDLMRSFMELRYVRVSNKKAKTIAVVIEEGKKLLEELLGVIRQEEDVLLANLSQEAKIGGYNQIFHEELDIYKRFEDLSKGLNPNALVSLRKSIERGMYNESPFLHMLGSKDWTEAVNEIVKAITVSVIAYGCIGLVENEFIEVSLNEIKRLSAMAFFSATLLDFLNQIDYYRNQLIELRKLKLVRI